MEKREIQFAGGKKARAVLAPVRAGADELAQALDLPGSKVVILLTGGAGLMEQSDEARLQALFTDGLASAASALDALIIDGGTESGVMALMGRGVAQQEQKPILLGISPEGKVSYPGKAGGVGEDETGPLDPNHAYFVLVETDQWGGETAVMYELGQFFSRGRPSVAVLVNGGDIARNEVLYNVRQKRPIIVIEGSGRLADEIASQWRQKNIPASDQTLAEVVKDGNIHLFPLTGTPQQLKQLLFDLLRRQLPR
ncbi:MAG TPA: hypothetical protein VKV40_05070 [Ktedonobacteraceae bacterium]|nr:hypothetical protein [Ktedonobacteraceae bacterium]